MAVNTYTSPVYTADLDLVVVSADLEPILADLRAADFHVKEDPFSVNAQRREGPGETSASRLMVQFTKLDRYQDFVERAVLRPVFGLDVPVAALADVVQGKLWAWSDPARRPTKKLKDHLDLMRLAEEHFGEVSSLLPSELRKEAEAQQQRVHDDGWGGDDLDPA